MESNNNNVIQMVKKDGYNTNCLSIVNKDLESEEHEMILQPNVMTYSRYDAEAVQIKVLMLIVKNLQTQIKKSINKDGDDFLFDFYDQKEISIRFQLRDIVSDARRYGEVKKLLRRLPDIIIEIPVKDQSTGKRYSNIGSFIRSVSIPVEAYDTEFIVNLNPDVASVLMNGKSKGYRELMLQTILNSKSKYTQRLYDIFSGFKKQGFVDMSVTTLRDVLKLEGSYKYWSQFKIRVLDTAAKELKSLFDYNLSDFYVDYSYEVPEKGDPVSIHVTLHLAVFAQEREIHNRVASLKIEIIEQLKDWGIYNYGMPQRLGLMKEEELLFLRECIGETKKEIDRQKGAINCIAIFARKTLKEIGKKKKKSFPEKSSSPKELENYRYYTVDDADIRWLEKMFFRKIASKIGPELFEFYFKPSSVNIEVSGNEVIARLQTPSYFVYEQIEKRCSDAVGDVLLALCPQKKPKLIYKVKN